MRALGTAALIAAAGCAAVAPGTPPRIEGRLSLQVAAHDGQAARGFNAGFELLGDARAGELRLSTPMGPQIARARWAPGEATLESADGIARHPDLDALAQQAFGESLPLQALPDWLRGRPWPGAPSRARDDGAPGFEQLGWSIALAQQSEGLIVAARAAAPALALRVRLLEP
ncbi:MAG: outer membrane lipoprotein LolB [Burkholderiales bacterium]|nr:outer membrane lipoprotein LolB [Burkholderiales bacterium]